MVFQLNPPYEKEGKKRKVDFKVTCKLFSVYENDND